MNRENWHLCQVLSRSIVIVAVLLLGLAAVSQAQRPGRDNACRQIVQLCQNAGFVPGGAKGGSGIQVDCVQPIMQGRPKPRAGIALPQVDPQLVAACREANPAFGQSGSQTLSEPASAPPPSAPSHAAAPGSPNIVFILTDDLAMNLVQFMPHVLAMQKNGTTFTNYFVSDSLCCPSRSSIFTGRYPHDTGVFKNVGKEGGYEVFRSRGNEEKTFAVALSAAGYRTAFLGKYLNGYEPGKHDPVAAGWNHWVVAGNGYGEFRYAFNLDGKLVTHASRPEDYLTDVVSEDGVHFIKQKTDAPFFIEIATFAPHAPYVPAPRDAGAFPQLRAPRDPAYNATPDAAAPHWLVEHGGDRSLSQAEMDSIDSDFRKRAQSVLAVDKMIGELEAAVTAIGQVKNTYFVFSSDNGYHMGEYRLMPGKMTAYDTDIHVPLVITGPGVPAGRRIEEIAENIDLCPTFLEIASAELQSDVDGVSLAPLWKGQTTGDWRGLALVEHHGPVNDPVDPDLPSVRSGNPTTYEAIRLQRALYVEYSTGEKEYHDLDSDPDELRNTYASLSEEDKAALHRTLKATVNCHNSKSCWAAQRAPHLAAQK